MRRARGLTWATAARYETAVAISDPSGGLGAGRYLKETVNKALASPQALKEVIADPAKLLKGIFK